MKQSMEDYVLERGNRDYGEFYRRSEQVEPSLRLNQRKLLEYLFNPHKSMKYGVGDAELSTVSSPASQASPS